jgi:DNA primase
VAGPVFDSLTVDSFTHPGYSAVRSAIGGAGGTAAGLAGAQWIEAVREQTASPAAASLVNELGVEAINVDDDDKLQRMSPVDQGDEYHALFGDLVAMEAYRRSLLEQASGDDLTA